MKPRDRRYWRASKTSQWVTPLCGVAFLGIAWLIGRVVIVLSFVYWIIVFMLGLTWLVDVINLAVICRRNRPEG